MSADQTVQPEPIRVNATAGSVRVGLRAYLSSQFLRSAIRMQERAAEIEREHAGKWSDPQVAEHRDLVLSSHVTSVAFFDSMINELFTDAFDEHGLEHDGYLAPLNSESHRLMKAYWRERGNRRTSMLSRYRIVCEFAQVEPIDSGGQFHENAKLAIEFRNALVHYTPQTMYADDVHNLERSLASTYEANGLMPADSGNPWWPDRALSADGARWSVEAVEAYADEFSDRLDIVPNYQRLLRGKKPDSPEVRQNDGDTRSGPNRGEDDPSHST